MRYLNWKSARQPSPQPVTPPPPQHSDAATPIWIWYWDGKKKIRDGYWVPGPPPEPPGLRPVIYHSAFQEHMQPTTSWLYPRGRPVSWWARRT
jgi:hypothetical protein